MTTTDPIKLAHAEALQMDSRRAQLALQERGAQPGGRQRRRPSLHDAAVEILRELGPMRTAAVAEALVERKLAPPSRTLVERTSAALSSGTRNKGVFIRVATGTYDLRELNPRGAKTRPGS